MKEHVHGPMVWSVLCAHLLAHVCHCTRKNAHTENLYCNHSSIVDPMAMFPALPICPLE